LTNRLRRPAERHRGPPAPADGSPGQRGFHHGNPRPSSARQ